MSKAEGTGLKPTAAAKGRETFRATTAKSAGRSKMAIYLAFPGLLLQFVELVQGFQRTERIHVQFEDFLYYRRALPE